MKVFSQRLQEMNVQLGLETADGRLLSTATQSGPSSPIKSQILSLGGLIGLIMGASLVLFWELRFSGYRSVNELRDSTGCTVFWRPYPSSLYVIERLLFPIFKTKPILNGFGGCSKSPYIHSNV